MRKLGSVKRVLGVTSVIGCVMIVLAACGSSGTTATPTPPTATARPAATPTLAPQPTAPPPSPTPAPALAPGASVPTPIVLSGKRGGTLNLSTLGGYLSLWDTLSVGGRGALPPRNSMYNNLLWNDPYNPSVLVGDVAQGWELSDGGKSITFFMRKGIKFHDGAPLTSKDVVYNLDRAWKPRTATMTEFVGKLTALQGIEAPDDYTVRLTLSTPSNYLLAALATAEFLVYPAHWPIEDQQKFDQYKKGPIGSGPFKFKAQDSAKLDLVRNDDYWKPGLPYVDNIVEYVLLGESVTAAFRVGKLDAVNLDIADVDNHVDTLASTGGWVKYPLINGQNGVQVNQRPPFNDVRVRQAYSLAFDRYSLLQAISQGRGTILASPMPPPEVGGQWGIPAAEMKDRPGFRQDKTEDLARAKQLIAQTGIDPSKFTVSIIATDGYPPVFPEIMESAARELGFKTQAERLPSPVINQRLAAGTFDLNAGSLSPMADDPLDFLVGTVGTGGSNNNGKWSNPQLDALFAEQDRTLNQAKRKLMIREIQETVLTDLTFVPGAWRISYGGHYPWVKNYPGKAPFLFSHRFRWEQVWLERPS